MIVIRTNDGKSIRAYDVDTFGKMIHYFDIDTQQRDLIQSCSVKHMFLVCPTGGRYLR